jgi:hypothetical protein
LEEERRECGLVRVGHFEQLEGGQAREIWKGGGKRVVENGQPFEVRELTDGLWDGLDLVVEEAPMKEKREKVNQKVQMR